MSRPIQSQRAPRMQGLAACLLAAVFLTPACTNPDEVLSINKVNLSFTRAKVIDVDNPNQPPDLDGEDGPDSPRYLPGDVVRKTVTLRNSSPQDIPLRIFIDNDHPTAREGAAFEIDTALSPPAEAPAVVDPFNYLLEGNSELEIAIMFKGLIEGFNISRLQIISEAYQGRERCDGMDVAGCIEVVLQGTVDCTSLHTEETPWDADLDGYCVAPEGFTLDSEEDCEDRPDLEGWRASPGLDREVCELGENQLDTDCDGSVELITDRDSDGVCDLLADELDAFGNPVLISCTSIPENDEGWTYPQALAAACGLDPTAAAGFTLDEWVLAAADDCEDSDTDADNDGIPDSASNFPGNAEICEPGGLDEQRDNNCSSDDDSPSAVNWPPAGMVEYHRDTDGDTYGAVNEASDSVWYCGGSPSEEGFTPARPQSGTDPAESCSSNDDCLADQHCVAAACRSYLQDCDDDDVERFPDAPVRCNGIDDNCDLLPDQITSNPIGLRDDSDADGDGRPICSGEECSDPLSDTDPTVYRGAPELCDGKDNDCDGAVPTSGISPTGQELDETDDDQDDYIPCQKEPLVQEICRCTDALEQGFSVLCDAQATPPITDFCMPASCNRQVGLTTNPEFCANGIDDDGDGDADCDDYDCRSTPICTPSGPNCALQSGDYDDGDSSRSPVASEELNGVSRCDFQDNDCDGLLHPTETDDDGDATSGQLGAGTECGPDGDIEALSDNDCNDTLATVYAGATEICDGIDNNCDLLANYNSGGLDELDNDGDGYVECSPAPSGLVGLAGGNDCNDDASDPVASNVYPYAPEIPDSYWNNGVFRWVDNQCPGNPGWDAGGTQLPGEYCFSNITSSAADCASTSFACMACAAGSETDRDGDGFTEAQGDCNDGPISLDPAAGTISPGAVEICDGLDNNCDGQLMGAEQDTDGDGYVTCWPPPDPLIAIQGGDCDNSQSLVNPSRTEIANGVDDDCNGLVDDGTTSFDDDGDGFTEDQGDCDDSDPNRAPSNTELCDGVDNDCDPATYFGVSGGPNELDEDGDGYSQCADGDCLDSGDQLLSEIANYPAGSGLQDVAHRLAVAAAIHPNAPPLCDGWTNDCSEQTTAGALAYVPLAATQPNEFDNDGDGFVECDDGGAGAWSQFEAHANRLLTGGNDCLDLPGNPYAANVNPGEPVDLCDGYDTNCSNGAASNTPDQADEQDDDGDSYIHCDNFVVGAVLTGGLGLNGGGDCLDEAGNSWSDRVHPGVSSESCDGYDTDCSNGGSTHAPDGANENDDDADGYIECSLVQNSNWVNPGGILGGDDCLDVTTNPYSDDVNPGEPVDLCDGYDTNCDGGTGTSFPDQAEEDDEDNDFYIECANFVVAAEGTGAQTLLGGDDCLDNPPVQGGPAVPYSFEVNPDPSTADVCDGYDTDCSSGSSDPDLAFEEDDDGDGYIECTGFVVASIATGESHPQSLVGGGDCLDQTSNSYSDTVNPGAVAEACDGYDTDCSSGSSVPELLDEQDHDGDDYIACTGFVAAAAGTGVQALIAGGDCVDDAANSYSDQINPGAPAEACDGYDTNCSSGSSSPDVSAEDDDDGDGYVECAAFVSAAAGTGGLGLVDGDDCLDVLLSGNSYSGDVNPGANELCDGYDTDCSTGNVLNLDADEIDNDTDFYIECSSFVAAAAGTTSANLLVGRDCDDTDSLDFPGGIETCNADDEDCDGVADNGLDGDGDGVTPCGPDGISGNSDDDCDDALAAVFPGNTADATSGECMLDADGDNYGDESATAPYDAGTDCDDNDIFNFPGNPEVCDGADNDCDTVTDNGLDGDGDGVTPCGPDGISGNSDDDCDDGDSLDFPGGIETCNADDEDCDGVVDNGLDVDGDGVTPCGLDGTAGTADDDCDDNPLTGSNNFPGNPEVCDAADNDCNTAVDNGFDGDGDGITTCGADGVSGNTDDDCDDGDPDVNPSEPEICDGLDNNCDSNFGANEPTTPGAVTSSEDSSTLCVDTLDNDCNGLVDAAESTCGWQDQSSPTSTPLNSVFARSATRAHVAGEGGEILLTIDGGSNWTAQTSGSTDNLTSLYFVNDNLGWVVGNNGTILVTSDGGANWSSQSSGSGDNLFSVYFTGANVGWAVGAGGTVLTTADAGVTWNDVSVSVGATVELTGVFFADVSTGWIVGDNSKIFATVDGGVTWVAQTNGVPTGTVLSGVTAVSSTVAWICGQAGKVLRTTDGGATWAETNTGGSILNGISFVDVNEGWVVGNGPQVFVTEDGGVTFTEQTSLPTTEQLRAVGFVNAEDGWAVGESGTIIHTTSGGR